MLYRLERRHSNRQKFYFDAIFIQNLPLISKNYSNHTYFSDFSVINKLSSGLHEWQLVSLYLIELFIKVDLCHVWQILQSFFIFSIDNRNQIRSNSFRTQSPDWLKNTCSSASSLVWNYEYVMILSFVLGLFQNKIDKVIHNSHLVALNCWKEGMEAFFC